MRYADLLLCLATLLLSACVATPIHEREALAEPGTTVVEVKGDRYNRLHTGVRLINLPTEARTVEAASQWVLESTGYRLSGDPALLRRPLSPLAQVPDYMSIEQALLAIIGGENALAVDIARGRIAVEPILKGAEVTKRVVAKDLVD